MFRTSLNIQNGGALDNGFEIFKRLKLPFRYTNTVNSHYLDLAYFE